MARSFNSEMKAFKKGYNKIRNDARKQAGMPIPRKPARSHSPFAPSKTYKSPKLKPMSRKQIEEMEKRNLERSKNGCYIATCVYGSYDCPEVWTLRRFRDYKLRKTWYGRGFIKLYYSFSPLIVHWLGKKAWFGEFWKKHLDVWVGKLRESGIESTKYNDIY